MALNHVSECYGKQNLLQDFYRTVDTVKDETREYFSNLGLAGFNKIFMDLFFWLKDHSFDPGLNGYVYLSTSGNVVNNLNASIHNRIGYLAHLLGFSHAKNMVNPKIFSMCVDALTILIYKALPYYGSIPISVDQIIPIMSEAILTERFIDFSRQSQVLETQISQYNHTVDKLRATLLEWIDSTRYKIGYNIHDKTLEQMVSATPISTGVRYASDIGKHWANLPITLNSPVDSILQIYKLCEVAVKLGLGNYEFIFSLSHGEPFGNWKLNIPVTINILMNFILDGKIYNINSELWHAPALTKGLNSTLTSDHVLGWWQHDYKSQRWTLQNYTQTNTYFENVLKEACEKKLNSIRQEMSSIQYPIGSQVSTLCDVLQEKYIIINKLFELNDTVLGDLNSGVWIKTRLIQLIHHENTYGYDVVSFCDFVKEKSLKVKPQYNNSTIKDGIKSSILRLEELIAKITVIQREFKIIKEQETKNILDIGIKIGRLLTINAVLKELQSEKKIDEVGIMRERYGSETQHKIQREDIETITLLEGETQHKIQIVEDDIQRMTLFNSSICNGIGMVLIEISIYLKPYLQTVVEIQVMCYQILRDILRSPVKSIGDTISRF